METALVIGLLIIGAIGGSLITLAWLSDRLPEVSNDIDQQTRVL